MTKRRATRTAVFKVIFAAMHGDENDGESAWQSVCEAENDNESADEKTEMDSALFALLLDGYFSRREETMRVLAAAADRPLDRIGAAERALLLAATAELICRPETPRKVVINEAIELAKKFAPEDARRYINGVLDKVARNLRPDGDSA